MHKGTQEPQTNRSQRGFKIPSLLQTGAAPLSPALGYYSHSSGNEPHGETFRFLEINSAAVSE